MTVGRKTGSEKTGGRKKGTPNKLTGHAKDSVYQVFNRLGGTSHMAKWAEENPNQFYQLFAKLIPIEVNGAGDNGEHLSISRLEVVLVEPKD